MSLLDIQWRLEKQWMIETPFSFFDSNIMAYPKNPPMDMDVLM